MAGVDTRVGLVLDRASYERLLGTLDDRRERLANLRPALDGISDDFLDLERSRFAGAAHWKPLTAEWALRKAAGGRSPLPLAGGALERSLTVRGSRYTVLRRGTQSVTMGTRDPVAHIHDRGTKRMPRRSPIDLVAADRARWVKILHDHLAGKR